MKLVLIRHPPPSIALGLCYGRLDIGLTLAGEAQIGMLAADPALQGATRVWTSPARRCRGLADAIAVALAARLTVDDRLQELDFGAWEGTPWDTVPRAELDRWAASPLSFAPGGGETGSHLIDRVGEFYADLCRDQQDSVVVSHGGPLKILTALLQNTPVDLLAAAPPMSSIRTVTYPANSQAEDARHNPFAERLRPLPPRNDTGLGGRVAQRCRNDIAGMALGIKVADDIGPFSRRCQRNRAGPLADRQTLDRRDRDATRRTTAQTDRDSIEQQAPRRVGRRILSLAGDADERRDRRITHASIP